MGDLFNRFLQQQQVIIYNAWSWICAQVEIDILSGQNLLFNLASNIRNWICNFSLVEKIYENTGVLQYNDSLGNSQGSTHNVHLFWHVYQTWQTELMSNGTVWILTLYGLWF